MAADTKSSFSPEPCARCKGMGRVQLYRGGRVRSVYCDCPAGDRFVERVSEGITIKHRLPRVSDFPSEQRYYGLGSKG